MQDATMQRRMDAGMRKYAAPGTQIVNYAGYAARVAVKDGQLCYERPIHGMWTIERYAQLLMGEIPRLRDDTDGYGPAGRGFIAHTDVPEAVLSSFYALQEVFGTEVRPGNPKWASEKANKK